jgi:hypothetical protein
MSDQLPNLLSAGALIVASGGLYYTIRVGMKKDRADRAVAHQVELEKAEARGREKALSDLRIDVLEQEIRDLGKKPGGET